MPARDDFDDFWGDDDTSPVVDTRADGRLYRVPLSRLAANLVNPRTDFGTEDQLIDLGKSLARRQNQPCPVVSRGAYLKLWPDHDDRIGDVDYVLVSGERRYRAATAVGLTTLDCVVNDDFAADRKTFMEAVVSENVDRQNFDPVEEAYAVQALVSEFGSNRAVAQHFERVDGWVTQRVLLTHLAPEMQKLVRDKSMPLEAARRLGKLARDNGWDAGQQAVWWEEEQDRRAAASAARAAARKAPKSPPVPAEPVATIPAAAALAPVPRLEPAPAPPAPSFTAVKPDPSPDSAPAADKVEHRSAPAPAVEPARSAAERVPDPRPEPATEGRPFPYDSPGEVALLLAHKMSDDVFFETVQRLVSKAADRDAARLEGLLREVVKEPAR